MESTQTTYEILGEINQTIRELVRLRAELVETIGKMTTEGEQKMEVQDTGKRLPAPYSTYSVTCDGQIFSHRNSKSGVIEMSQVIASNGYKSVKLTNDLTGKRDYCMTHTLVALAFYGKRPSDKPVVRHLDGNKYNNHITNLAYGTYKENAQDAVKHGAWANVAKGEDALHAKLTNDDVYGIRLMRARGFTYAEIKAQFPDVSMSSIVHAALGKTYKNADWPNI